MSDNDRMDEGYKPPMGFEEDTKDPLLEISLTDSTELWLIQWPVNQLNPKDFHGKEVSLKLHRDGELGTFESSSGKTYDLVSYNAQKPDATVFMPSSAESSVVGKISRRVCMVRYPDPAELEKNRFNSNLSSRFEGSRRKSMSHLTSTHSMGEKTIEPSQLSRKKERKESIPPSEALARSVGQSSRGSRPESRITDTSYGSEKSHEKSKKRKKIKVED